MDKSIMKEVLLELLNKTKPIEPHYMTAEDMCRNFKNNSYYILYYINSIYFPDYVNSFNSNQITV